jgi:hypothetical protein
MKNREALFSYKNSSGGSFVFLIIYIDDILLIVNVVPIPESMKKVLKGFFL